MLQRFNDDQLRRKRGMSHAAKLACLLCALEMLREVAGAKRGAANYLSEIKAN